jgi:acetolactate synthase small subunit
MSTAKTIYCKLQNRLGALDRVLAAFTHRGIIPGHMSASHDEAERMIEITINFDCADCKVLDKLVKFLQKQVYVMETRTLTHDASIEQLGETMSETDNSTVTDISSSNSPKSSQSRVIHEVHFERKVAHAHNA